MGGTPQTRMPKFKLLKIQYEKILKISYYRDPPIMLTPPPLTTKSKRIKFIE